MTSKPDLQPLLESMRFRCIGPPRGGRVVAVAGDPSEPAVFYFGAVAGGIWKTDDAGTTWVNVSDRYLETSSVGALAVAESEPCVVYAGMGESTIRSDVSHGDGVYRSTDGGETWTHLGLAATRHIGEIRVHPKDPDTVYVAALGQIYGRSSERGVYRSRDGGKRWQRVLYKSDKAGAIDITVDLRNPAILYATLWEVHRNAWELSSGGPDCGIWKSIDGGDTWAEITRNPGLPGDGMLAKIGISASPARAGRVWALVESSVDPGLYRSDDFGETWALVTDNQDLRYRPFYYMHVFADTQDPDTVYVNNQRMWRSTDGGRHFTAIATPHGDNHDLWIDPHDNRRMIQGNDGGANVSFNAGGSWSTIHNQLTAQFYTVTTDTREPHYRVYGTQQDNSSISVPSNTNDGAIVMEDCYSAGTGESGYMAVHPDDPDIVYVGSVGSAPGGGGALQRYHHGTGQVQLVNVWPAAHGGIGPGALKYRFPWTYPILFSPHDPGVLYTAGNVVFRSTDEGQSWEPLSPDLTRNDPAKLGPSGGPVTKDTSGAEHYCTVYTLRESPHEPGVFWAGSDDGLVHVSRDGATTWRDVTPPGLPEWSFIRTVEPSPHDPATLYLAATAYRLGDTAPYLYKTSDYGESWQSITGTGAGAIPEDDYTRVIRADPNRAGVLYAGTEIALYVSLDDGGSWRRWKSNLPVTPVYDMTVKDTDLVLATHGRSFWILDDLTPLYQSTKLDDGAALFAPRTTWRLLPDSFDVISGTDGKDYSIGMTKSAAYIASKDDAGQLERTFLDAGQGAPAGVIVYYRLPEAPNDAEATLAFLDRDGELMREFRPKPAEYDKRSDEDKALDPGPWMPLRAGMNRFVWDLRYPGAMRLRGNKTGAEANRGALVLPGDYQVRLRVGAETLTEWFSVVNDARSPASTEELRDQLTLLLQIRDKITELYVGVGQLRAARDQVGGWRARLKKRGGHDAICAAARAIEDKLAAIETRLILPGEQIDVIGLNEPMRLNEVTATVISVIESADTRPTAASRMVFAEYSSEIDVELAKLRELLSRDLSAFNAMVSEAGLPAVIVD